MPSTLGVVAAHHSEAVLTGPPTTGQALWLDADDATTFTFENDRVSQWRDKSGNNRHAALASAGPYRDGNIGGRTALRFVPTTTGSLSIPAFATGFTSAELFVVLKVTTNNNGAYLGLWGTSTEYAHYTIGTTIYEPWGTTVRKTLTGAVHDISIGHIYNVRTSPDLYEAAANGTLFSTQTGNVVAFRNTPYEIPMASNYPIGQMGELFVYNRILTTAERTATINYLKTKWIPAGLQEPFNDYTTNGWVLTSTPTIVAARTGNGGNFFSTTQRADYNIAAAAQSDTITVGFAFRRTDTGTSTRNLCLFHSDSGATEHLRIQWNTSTSTMTVLRAGVTIASATSVTFAQNTWYYVEVQAKLHDTTGYVIVRVNGADVINATGLDTKNAGTKTVFDQFRLLCGLTSATNQYDDLYLVAGATFQGDHTIP